MQPIIFENLKHYIKKDFSTFINKAISQQHICAIEELDGLKQTFQSNVQLSSIGVKSGGLIYIDMSEMIKSSYICHQKTKLMPYVIDPTGRAEHLIP